MALALLLAACDLSFGGEALDLTEVVVTAAVDAEGRPTSPSTSFAPDAPVIHVSALVRGAESGAVLSSTWAHAQEGVFAEVPLTINAGASYNSFEMTRPTEGWPVGSYTVSLTLANPDGEQVVREASFEVTEPAAAPPPEPETDAGAPQLAEIVVTAAVDADSRPTDPTQRFTPEAPVVYVSVLVVAAAPGTVLTATWEHEREGVFAEVPLDVNPGSTYNSFNVTQPPAGWPVGSYTVRLVLTTPDGAQVTEQASFVVEDTGTAAPEPAPDASGAPEFDIELPPGYPAGFPLSSATTAILDDPEEPGLFILLQATSKADTVTFLDEVLPTAGWTIVLREEDDPEVDGVLYLAVGDNATVLAVVSDDPDFPAPSAIILQVDPEL